MYLVTGGAGFIGSNLVAALDDRGDRVAVCDRFGTGDKWKNLRRRELEALVAPESLGTFLEERADEVSAVIHLGAISATTETDADLIVDTNVRLSQSVWRWCTHQQVPLIYASSAATYGDGEEGFDDDGSPEALARLLPLNAYGWSKHLFDRWVARRVADGEPTPPAWAGLKFFNVYGPNEHHKGSMRSVVTKAWPRVAAGQSVTLFRSHHPDYADGGQMRDFVYVEDCVDVMLWLLDHPEVSGLFNLGTGRAQSWLELIGALFAAVGREPRIEWVDTPVEIRDRYQYFTQASMDRLRAAGYDRPLRAVEDAVPDYVERFLAPNRYR
ncbi:ADP-glyceromanno-heptose 6-epimerase [Gemmatimonadota bacterium Y43]|uniref:ADP-glyceromanno-heptose 6-epimerase n=1 Tax=Gaopeijia maritima TaxID=3119007 RepID=UPI00328B57A1